MKLLAIVCLLAVTSACSNGESDGRSTCTLQSIGADAGKTSLHATLMVPRTFLSGVEISNGGVHVLGDDCDFVLNASISNESAKYIIEHAPKATLWDRATHTRRLVEASLVIWKLSGESRFFVMGVQEMTPIVVPRTPHESDYYRLDTQPR